MVGDWVVCGFWFVFVLFLFWGEGQAEVTGLSHPLAMLIGHLIAGKDGFGATAGSVG